MKKNSFSVILLFLSISLTGCAEQNILDRVGLTTLIGYDLGSDEKMSTTVVIREVNPEFQSNVEVITTENETSKGNRIKINRKLAKKIMAGQMRVVLFGDELAKDDIHPYLDTLLESASISNSLYMAVVEGQTTPLIDYDYKDIEDVGQHISRLLEQNFEQEYMISSTLHEIAHDYYSVGKDIAMPILKKEQEFIELSGIALFKEGKMVSTLPVEDSFYLKLIRDNFKSGLFETVLEGEDIPQDIMKSAPNRVPVAFDTIHSKRYLKLIDKNTPEFDLRFTLKSRLLEIYPDVNLGDPKVVDALEKAISKNLTKEISRVIELCQKYDSDVFGFGEKYRSSVRKSNLTQDKWAKMYKNMKVNVKVDFIILRDGVFE